MVKLHLGTHRVRGAITITLLFQRFHTIPTGVSGGAFRGPGRAAWCRPFGGNRVRLPILEFLAGRLRAMYRLRVSFRDRDRNPDVLDPADGGEDLVKIYALIGRIRLVSARPVITAERTFDTIIQAYIGPNRALHEMLDDVHRDGFHFLAEFGEACR